MSDPVTTPEPASLFRVLWDTTTKKVKSFGEVAARTQRWVNGEGCYYGSQAECEAFIDARKLILPPDPVLVAAKAAKLASLSASLKAALLAQFASAPLGGQWQFDPVRAGCDAALEKGDRTRAVQGLQDTLDHNLVPAAFAPLVDNCIGWIQAYEASFAAVESATTVAAVEAVTAPTAA